MNDNDIELITSLIAGELSPVEQEEGMARVEASPQLRSAYDEQLSVATALRAEPRASMTAAERTQLNTTLRAELHIEEAAAPAAAVASGWNRWWAPLTGLATAAVIIIAVVVAPNVFDDDGSTGVASAPSAMTTTPTLASDPLAGAVEDTDTSQGGEQQADTSEGVEERAAAAPTTLAAAATELDAPDTSSYSLKAAPDAPANLELPVLGGDIDVADVESATRRATEQATVDYAAISRCFGSAGEATGEAVIVGSVTQSGDEVVAVVTVAATGEEIVLTINLATCGVTSAGWTGPWTNLATMTNRDRDLPAEIADFLQTVTTKIRSMTVDRAENAITWSALGIMLAMIAILGVIWLLVAFFRAFGELVGQEVAYAIVGGILIVVGALVWMRRFPEDDSGQE